MRFALITATLVTIAVTACGVSGWYWTEASRQAATFGGVQVLPTIGETILVSALVIGAFTLAATLVAHRAKASRVTIAALAISAGVATLYGLYGSSLYDGAPPFVIGTIFKASSIMILGVIALLARSRLLAAGLLFGAAGDALLAWSEQTFLYGALAFLIGHLCYIALFLRSGVGVSGLKRDPLRLVAMLAVAGPSIALNTLLVPADSALYAPLLFYSLVLTAMTISSFTLPWPRWLAMAGAVLFLISDGFVAAHMFHADDPLVANFWFGLAGWMLYWTGQAGLCMGALGLHKRA